MSKPWGMLDQRNPLRPRAVNAESASRSASSCRSRSSRRCQIPSSLNQVRSRFIFAGHPASQHRGEAAAAGRAEIGGLALPQPRRRPVWTVPDRRSCAGPASGWPRRHDRLARTRRHQRLRDVLAAAISSNTRRSSCRRDTPPSNRNRRPAKNNWRRPRKSPHARHRCAARCAVFTASNCRVSAQHPIRPGVVGLESSIRLRLSAYNAWPWGCGVMTAVGRARRRAARALAGSEARNR